ncbi:MAG: SPOR domain-containing protein [Betaproteobacteria bacterium]
MADSDSSALEDARRRARRRLVGAVVLALAAAVVLPMFLESDPKPLGTDVQIQIPAMDDGKFQNRLTPPAGKSSPEKALPDKAVSDKAVSDKAVSDKAAPATKLEPAKPVPDDAQAPPEPVGNAMASTAANAGPATVAERVPAGGEPVKNSEGTPPQSASLPEPGPAAPKSAPVVEMPAAKKEPARKEPAKKDSRAPTVAEKPPAIATLASRPSAIATPALAAAAPAPPPAPPATNLAGIETINPKIASPPPGGEFVVQLGAFIDAAVAKELAEKAGGQGYQAFLETVTTKGGPVQRVRVGPFVTRAAADAAAAKLKAAGFTAVARPR